MRPVSLAVTAALREPSARAVADVNERAMDLLRLNVARMKASTANLAPIEVVTAEDVPADARFDTIWSNPPIRIGKAALHELLAAWLPRLVPGGEAWLVVQRRLGADSRARWIAEQRDDGGVPWGQIEKVRSAKGFRVPRLVRRA